MLDLNTYLPSIGVDLTGWHLTKVNSISADGSAIVGYGVYQGGSYRAFLVTGLTVPGTGSCPVDFDGDGFVTGLDFDAYVAAFETGDSVSDFNGDGFVTGLDFDAFVQAFEAGC